MVKIKNRDKPLIAAMVLLLLLAAGCFGILAYSTYRDQTVNAFTVGYGEIAIEEDFKPPRKLLPGISIKKEVAVANTGPVPCSVRVLAKYTSSKMIKFSSVDFNTEAWTAKGDYFYYNSILQPGEKTIPLFTSIQIQDNVSQAQLEPFDVLIYAEAIQADGVKWD
ncbi:hypothetical protein NE619_01215 [Anaerovorax odorimutans]|uniref:DUF4352 domain-containing protein n=1 Tax=Anaerovorax odorimutans TaxID=109327 RepID=A0ABT1RJH2_9FIRM|nr:hypothetical protein [Anaerovorax odorimutans]MCQ4635335.1 hypothetical protein [Anaerovorax odorimutans]